MGVLYIYDNMKTDRKLSRDEILAIEKAKDERQRNRRKGFSMMTVRDKGWARLSNGTAMLWHSEAPLKPGEVRRNIPEGSFVLVMGGEERLFDAEEFRRWLRWA